MSNQEGCRPSSDYDIQKSVIERIFDERKQYLIIALTGKIGAGSSYVSSFIQDSCWSRDISRDTPGLDGFSSDEQRANSILLRYFNCNRIPFHVIRVRDVITSFIVKDEAWERLAVGTQNIEHIKAGIVESFHRKIKRLSSSIRISPEQTSAFIGKKGVSKEEAEGLKTDVDAILADLDKGEIQVLSQKYNEKLEENNLGEKDEHSVRNYILYVLPLLADCIRKSVSNDYTSLFQQLGNDLRFYGTLSTKETARPEKPLVLQSALAHNEELSCEANSLEKEIVRYIDVCLVQLRREQQAYHWTQSYTECSAIAQKEAFSNNWMRFIMGLHPRRALKYILWGVAIAVAFVLLVLRKENLFVLIQRYYTDPDMAREAVNSIWNGALGILTGAIILIVNDLFEGKRE